MVAEKAEKAMVRSMVLARAAAFVCLWATAGVEGRGQRCGLGWETKQC